MPYIKNGNNGGKRENSGRKKTTLKKYKQHEARERFNIAIDHKWDIIIEKIDEWIEDGDKEMIKYVLDQRICKASQAIDLGGKVEITTLSYEQARKIIDRRRSTSDSDNGKV